MSTPVLGAGGPRPQAAIRSFVDEPTGDTRWAIVDGDEILAVCAHEHHAHKLLPIIQAGE